jgi:heme/copper-type cytochrome/quinol oxidase subunit 2
MVAIEESKPIKPVAADKPSETLNNYQMVTIAVIAAIVALVIILLGVVFYIKIKRRQ